MIPDYQSLMRPFLRLTAQGEIRVSDAIDLLADEFGLTNEERAELIPSGRQSLFYNRVHWAKTYLKQAGLIEYPKRGHCRITARGSAILAEGDAKIDTKLLRTFPEFQAFQARSSSEETVAQPALTVEGDSTPEELLRSAHEQITASVADELLERLRKSPPAFFERTIVSLLLAMGYGGSSEDAGRAIGQSGDDGVDGVIDQDPLGVDQIYIQAKRYADGNQVGASAIREFVGSLSLKKAQKGIFATTSGFSRGALDTARQIGTRIVLIDGYQLGRLMVRHNVGCRDQEILHVKRIDEDFFE